MEGAQGVTFCVTSLVGSAGERGHFSPWSAGTEQECDLAPLLQVVLVFMIDGNLVISKILACWVTASRWPLMVSV